MTGLTVLTLSYRPDFERFARLHKSVLAHTPPTVVHNVIVPKRDREIFRHLENPRLRIWLEPDVLPRGFMATASLAAATARIPGWPGTLRCSAVNLHRPWPPIRGWVLQQLLKLSWSSGSQAKTILIIDSDVVLVRDVDYSDFERDGAVRFYESPGAITAEMGRHMAWTQTAMKLLGLPPSQRHDHPDYIGGIVSWEPGIVRACLERVEKVSGLPWATVVGREHHFSEFILYGSYFTHFGSAEQLGFARPDTLCHSYWEPKIMSEDERASFLESFSEEHLAVHIQSNSGNSIELVDEIVQQIQAES